jgi:hypothetical protein
MQGAMFSSAPRGPSRGRGPSAASSAPGAKEIAEAPLSRAKVAALIGITAVFNTYMMTSARGSHIADQYIWGSVMLWLAAIPIILFAASSRRQTPIFALICTTYWIYYARPVFVSPSLIMMHRPVYSQSASAAIEIAAYGLAATLVGYYLLRPKTLASLALKIPIDLRAAQNRIAYVAIAAFLLGVLSMVGAIPGSLRQLAAVIKLTGLAFIGGLFGLASRRQLSSRNHAIAMVIAVLTVLVDLGTGAVALPLLDCLLLGLISTRMRGKVPWIPMAIAFVALLPFATTKHRFRAETWAESATERGPIEKGVYFISMTYDLLASGTVDTDNIEETTSDRTSHLGTLAHVIQETPARVAFWGGETYVAALWSFVPRLLYPGKPSSLLGQTFGHRYALLDAADTGTSYNFEQLVEAYANFGLPGVVVVQFIIGMLYRVFLALVDSEVSGDGGALIAGVVSIAIMNIESDFGLVFGALLNTVIVMVVMVRLVAGTPGPRRPTFAR